MRGRSLLWAGPGVLLLGGRAAEPPPLAVEEDEAPDVVALGERLVPMPAAAGEPRATSGVPVTVAAPPGTSRRRR